MHLCGRAVNNLTKNRGCRIREQGTREEFEGAILVYHRNLAIVAKERKTVLEGPKTLTGSGGPEFCTRQCNSTFVIETDLTRASLKGSQTLASCYVPQL